MVNGDLEIQDATLNINSLAGFGTGNYELIAFTTVGSDNLSLGSGTSSDFNYLIVDEANSIWLDVTPAAVTPVGPFTWTGANGSAWDINATQNWSNASGASKYADGYAVTFDDMAGAGHGTVSIAGTVDADVDPGQQQQPGLHVLRGRQHRRQHRRADVVDEVGQWLVGDQHGRQHLQRRHVPDCRPVAA